jgi:hypothetical protein
MKPALQVIVALVTFVAADHLRAALQRGLHSAAYSGWPERAPSWLGATQNFVAANVIIYAVVFAIAGAAVALLAQRRWVAVLLALLVGAASPASEVLFGSVAPLTWATHASWWLDLLFWCNWYVPPFAAALGALALSQARSNTGSSSHAA